MVEAQVAGLMKMPVGFVNICNLTFKESFPPDDGTRDDRRFRARAASPRPRDWVRDACPGSPADAPAILPDRQRHPIEDQQVFCGRDVVLIHDGLPFV
jgi:hypothetical protein